MNVVKKEKINLLNQCTDQSLLSSREESLSQKNSPGFSCSLNENIQRNKELISLKTANLSSGPFHYRGKNLKRVASQLGNKPVGDYL